MSAGYRVHVLIAVLTTALLLGGAITGAFAADRVVLGEVFSGIG